MASFAQSKRIFKAVAAGLHPDRISTSAATRWTSVRFFHASPVASSSSSKTFTFGIAASYTGKHQAYNSKKNLFVYHPSQPVRSPSSSTRVRHRSGQDDFYVSRVGLSADVAFGVADGVGGWDSNGFDSGDISDGLCTYMAYHAFTHNAAEAGRKLEAQSLMQRAYQDLLDDARAMGGSTTALAAVARSDGSLDVANLGDSGFVQFRLNAIHAYSEPQTHCFNTPYQLTVLPGMTSTCSSSPYARGCILNYPADADVSRHDLQHGDVLVFATDGLWDNLFVSDVLKIVSSTMLGAQAWVHSETGVTVGASLPTLIKPVVGATSSNLPSLLAQNITSEAKIQSYNMRRWSPHTLALYRMYPEVDCIGGKIDDICVLILVVCETEK
ncbi:hypothetical protein K3495_g8306 [Podosphaera aphanis]|nr:hypothetical protein K3495_g8306 [Podosphaera aphanis]